MVAVSKSLERPDGVHQTSQRSNITVNNTWKRVVQLKLGCFAPHTVRTLIDCDTSIVSVAQVLFQDHGCAAYETNTVLRLLLAIYKM